MAVPLRVVSTLHFALDPKCQLIFLCYLIDCYRNGSSMLCFRCFETLGFINLGSKYFASKLRLQLGLGLIHLPFFFLQIFME